MQTNRLHLISLFSLQSEGAIFIQGMNCKLPLLILGVLLFSAATLDILNGNVRTRLSPFRDYAAPLRMAWKNNRNRSTRMQVANPRIGYSCR